LSCFAPTVHAGATLDYHNLKSHPLAKLFPKYGEKELLDLASEIAANGLHNPIVLYQRQILDGVNRHQACLAASLRSKNNRLERIRGRKVACWHD